MASAEALTERVPILSLPVDCRVAHVATVLTELSQLLAEHVSLQIDGGNVNAADTATVQLLLVAGNEAAARGGRLTIEPRSNELTDAIRAAGAEQLLASN